MTNRVIKLRAWDGKGFGYVTLHPGSISVPTVEIWSRSSYSADHISFDNLEDWEQFTGLQDKNGKDIYEGDIIREKLVGENKVSLAVVEYEAPSFVVKRQEWLTVRHSKEVIGNIHENPELLTEKERL